MLKLKLSSLLILLSFIFYSCEKEYSLEGNIIGGTAVFTFNGPLGACTSAAIAGIYKDGAALDVTNTVTVSVDVATIGSYSISTAVQGGISFTSTGTFITTGVQTVTLAGAGTPTAGSYVFSPGGSSGCTFTITVTPPTATTSVFTFDGAPGGCNGSLFGNYFVAVPLTANENAKIDVNVTTIGTYNISTNTANGVKFSGTGSFTTTGPQQVTLTASGTPVAAGDFDFTPQTNGCKFPVTFDPTPAGINDYIKCSIDGVPRNFNLGITAFQVDPTAIAFGGVENTSTTSPNFQIGITKTPAITTGIYNRFSTTNITAYCIAQYSDALAVQWYIGIVNQPAGFTVTVTTYTATLIEGTFSGTLYDNTGLGTNTKVVTNGTFSVTY
ncbi:hypothetical protein BH11BAC3_BH11BAC3_04870 [soil metagenome]